MKSISLLFTLLLGAFVLTPVDSADARPRHNHGKHSHVHKHKHKKKSHRHHSHHRHVQRTLCNHCGWVAAPHYCCHHDHSHGGHAHLSIIPGRGIRLDYHR